MVEDGAKRSAQRTGELVHILLHNFRSLSHSPQEASTCEVIYSVGLGAESRQIDKQEKTSNCPARDLDEG